MNQKHEKAAAVLKGLVAQFLNLESNHTSMMTVTDLVLSPDRSRGTAYLSIFPVTDENKALDFANRKSYELYEYLKEHARMRAIPRIEFALDLGEKNRQRIDELLNQDGQQDKDTA